MFYLLLISYYPTIGTINKLFLAKMHIALNVCRVIIFLKIKYCAAEGLTSKDYREHCRALVNKVMTMDVQEKVNVYLSATRSGIKITKTMHVSIREDLPNLFLVIVGQY